jgi:hypothetical protein
MVDIIKRETHGRVAELWCKDKESEIIDVVEDLACLSNEIMVKCLFGDKD